MLSGQRSMVAAVDVQKFESISAGLVVVAAAFPMHSSSIAASTLELKHTRTHGVVKHIPLVASFFVSSWLFYSSL